MSELVYRRGEGWVSAEPAYPSYKITTEEFIYTIEFRLPELGEYYIKSIKPEFAE